MIFKLSWEYVFFYNLIVCLYHFQHAIKCWSTNCPPSHPSTTKYSKSSFSFAKLLWLQLLASLWSTSCCELQKVTISPPFSLVTPCSSQILKIIFLLTIIFWNWKKWKLWFSVACICFIGLLPHAGNVERSKPATPSPGK